MRFRSNEYVELRKPYFTLQPGVFQYQGLEKSSGLVKLRSEIGTHVLDKGVEDFLVRSAPPNYRQRRRQAQGLRDYYNELFLKLD